MKEIIQDKLVKLKTKVMEQINKTKNFFEKINKIDMSLAILTK